MVCDSKQMAYRVATAGAKKMGEGYRFERLDTMNWWVSNPAGGGYNVAIYSDNSTFCGCGFFGDNAQYGVCKHLVKLRWLLKAEHDRDEEQEYEDRIATEAEARMGAECPTAGCVSDKWRATGS
jgi:hypothetical protein